MRLSNSHRWATCLLASLPLLAPSADVWAQPHDTRAIMGIEWRWTQLSQAGRGVDLQVDNPELYTLTLQPDGTYRAQADCTWSTGNYVLDGSALRFTPGPTTLVECAPASLYYRYLALLGQVAELAVDDGHLILSFNGLPGQMVFVAMEAPDPQTHRRAEPTAGYW